MTDLVGERIAIALERIADTLEQKSENLDYDVDELGNIVKVKDPNQLPLDYKHDGL